LTVEVPAENIADSVPFANDDVPVISEGDAVTGGDNTVAHPSVEVTDVLESLFAFLLPGCRLSLQQDRVKADKRSSERSRWAPSLSL